MRAAKLPYYLRSALHLVRAAQGRPEMALALLAPPATVALREGLSFRVGTRLDLLILCETVLDDQYRLRRLATPPSVVADVGAGYGDFSLFAAHLYPGARVLAFEPEPVAFARLEDNIARNGSTAVEAHRAAIGTEGEPLEAVLPPGPVDVLKIDCEGAEDDVLASAGPALARVRHVTLEYHAGRQAAASTEALLERAGFGVAFRPDRYDEAIGYLDADRA